MAGPLWQLRAEVLLDWGCIRDEVGAPLDVGAVGQARPLAGPGR